MILLDTHVVLWWASDPARLSARVVREMATSERIYVSPASCGEIAELVALGRIGLDREVHAWVRDLCTRERVSVAPVDPAIAVSAGLLVGEGFVGDAVDRWVYATARALDVPLVTKDRRLRDHARQTGDVQCLW